MRGLRQTPVPLKLFGDGREMFGEVGEVFIGEIDVEVFGIELDAHQEKAGFFVGVFIGVQDVAVVTVDEVGDGGDFAFAVGAGDEEDGGGFHGRTAGPARTISPRLILPAPHRRKSWLLSVHSVARRHYLRTSTLPNTRQPA